VTFHEQRAWNISNTSVNCQQTNNSIYCAVINDPGVVFV
jgi:hypothetical protein